MKHSNCFILLLSVLINNVFSYWGEHGKREINPDTSSLNKTIEHTTNATFEDTTEVSPYLMSLKIDKNAILVDDELFFVGNINNESIDFYKLGKKVSRKDSDEYQKKYTSLSLMSGFIFPIGGPLILNNLYKKKVKPVFLNEYNLSNDNFKQLKSGYMNIYNKKRILKSSGFGTVGSIVGIGFYLYIVVIISEIINPSQPIE